MHMAGIVAREPEFYGRPDFSLINEGRPYPALVQEIVDRILDHFGPWSDQVTHVQGCSRPVRIRGRVHQVDKASGELRQVYSTDGEPDDVLLVACGSRSASKCPSCSWWYKGDAYQVIVTGLRGGKGVPDAVEGHPKVFVTLTAPSFGPVHARRVKGSEVLRCHPRDRDQLCRHGRALGCSVRHNERDTAVGTPLCPDCIDCEAQVIWNAMVPQLWHRFWTYLPRELARVMGMTQKKFNGLVRLRMAKVGEYQRRGVVHFHAIVRIDAAPPPGDPNGVAPSPAEFTTEYLDEAVRAARASAVIDCPELAALGRADTSIRWGSEIDVRAIRGGGPGELSHEAVSAYLSKYATKFSEALGLPPRPLSDVDDIDALEAPEHVKRLVSACVMLGGRSRLAALKLRQHAHGLGFGGHFLTKSRAFSTTMRELRAARRRHVRRQLAGDGRVILDAWGRPEDDGLVEVQAS